MQRRTRETITINTFMLEQRPWLTRVFEETARINRDRLSARTWPRSVRR